MPPAALPWFKVAVFAVRLLVTSPVQVMCALVNDPIEIMYSHLQPCSMKHYGIAATAMYVLHSRFNCGYEVIGMCCIAGSMQYQIVQCIVLWPYQFLGVAKPTPIVHWICRCWYFRIVTVVAGKLCSSCFTAPAIQEEFSVPHSRRVFCVILYLI